VRGRIEEEEAFPHLIPSQLHRMVQVGVVTQALRDDSLDVVNV
jgi:hypothetical protein